jgi:RNA polymerase sigma-70 factor, ECF subfamily
VALSSDVIQESHRRGRQSWPEIDLAADRFEAHVHRLTLSETSLQRHSQDLFLAFAVLEGDGEAVAAFDAVYLRPAAAGAARIEPDAAFVDQVGEQLRRKLIAPPAPALRGYAGAARLAQWLRVAALRTAIELKRSGRPLVPVAELPIDQLLAGCSIKPDALEDLRLGDFRRALEESFRGLTTRQRTLLRLHFVDGLALDALATAYGVHRATVARWLVAMRRTLFTRAKELLGASYPLASGAPRTLYRLLEEEVQVTLSNCLINEAPPDRAALP